jgi:hypothetical protein
MPRKEFTKKEMLTFFCEVATSDKMDTKAEEPFEGYIGCDLAYSEGYQSLDNVCFFQHILHGHTF